jgi:cytidyltransferase-like protein
MSCFLKKQPGKLPSPLKSNPEMAEQRVIVSGGFDDIRARDLRLIEEAAKLGEVTALLWPDKLVEQVTGKPPKFSLTERLYFLNAVRYIRTAAESRSPQPDKLPEEIKAGIWVDVETSANKEREAFCHESGMSYRVLKKADLTGFPKMTLPPSPSGRKRVVVTGCYDWFHSGHVRFFQEASGYGDLYVIVGHDANIRLLKGEGHPLVTQEERRYMAGSIKYVTQALISSGNGWLDADPEIQKLKPDVYIVNEDGDKGGKREYCGKMGIEYLVLKRTPAPGLPTRTSTGLRGF